MVGQTVSRVKTGISMVLNIKSCTLTESYNHSKDDDEYFSTNLRADSHKSAWTTMDADNDGNFQQSARAVGTPFGPVLSAETSKCCVAILNARSNSLWVQLTWYNTWLVRLTTCFDGN